MYVERLAWNPEMELMSEEKMRRLQWEKLKKMLEYVYEKSPFYRKKFDEAGIKPADIKNFDDFATKVPLTTKEELRDLQAQGYPFGTNLCCNYEDVVLVTASTGTTGKPTYTGVTQRDYQMWKECVKRTFWLAGMRPTDVYLHALALSTWISGYALIDSARELGATLVPVGVPVMAERLLMIAMDTKANAIACTPSYAEHLAERVRQILNRDPRELGFRKMCCGGEPGAGIPAVKKRIEEIWGCDLRDVMGTPEMIPADWVECRFKQGMHFVAREYCLNELVDPDTKAPMDLADGAEGSLVYTSLEKECAPLIRFEVGDRIKVFTSPCECGYPGIRISVIGRIDDMLKVKGVKTWPSAVKDVLSQMMPDVTGIFQIVLSEKPEAFAVRGPVRLRVEYGTSVTQEQLPGLKSRIADRIRTALVWSPDEVELVPEGTLPRAEMKARYIVIEPQEKK